MKRTICLTLLVASLLLTACATTGAQQQTLEAYDLTLAQQLEDLNLEATAEMERLLSTAESAQRRLGIMATQQVFMISTLQARGFDVSSLPRVQTPLPAVDAPAGPNAVPGGGDSGQPTPVPVTPFAPTDVPPPPIPADPNQPRLIDFVMSRAVGSDDCATSPTNQFDTSDPRIYIVARAQNISPGMTLAARWFREGQELVFFDFTPDWAIPDACVWFFATPVDFDFLPGSYTVNVTLDGAPAGPSMPFTIGGAMPDEPATDNDADDGA